MTFEHYKSKINATINSNERVDIDFSTILGLLAQYNLKYVSDDKKQDFLNKYYDTRKEMITEAFSIDAMEQEKACDKAIQEKNHYKAEEKRFEVAKKLLENCEIEIRMEFAKELDSYKSLYNVHNLVMSKLENDNLALDFKALTKANRLEGEKQMSQAKINEKADYEICLQNVKNDFIVLSNKEALQQFADKHNCGYELVLAGVKKSFEESVDDFVKPEKAYLNTVVEDVISWDKKFVKYNTQENIR